MRTESCVDGIKLVVVTDEAGGAIQDWITEDLVYHFREFGIYRQWTFRKPLRDFKLKKAMDSFATLTKK